MDCTYKTNRYKLPMLSICGAISLNSTFNIRYCFMRQESVEDYEWAILCLQQLMIENNSKNPRVFIIDRDRSLINALQQVFPRSKLLLCIWHINKNVLANCRPYFEKTEDWDAFYTHWQRCIYITSLAGFNNEWESLMERYQGHMIVENGESKTLTGYLTNTRIRPWPTNFLFH